MPLKFRTNERIPVRNWDSFRFYNFQTRFNTNTGRHTPLNFFHKIMAYMSQEGYDKLVAQLHEWETVDRPAASAAIAEARDKGDLSENAEYDAAKEAQANLEAKIAQLKVTIAEAKIIDASRIRTDIVQILSTVKMKNVANGMVMKYTIVSESEADLRAGKISSTTPIAQSLLGKKVGDIAEAKIPSGVIKLEILEITA